MNVFYKSFLLLLFIMIFLGGCSYNNTRVTREINLPTKSSAVSIKDSSTQILSTLSAGGVEIDIVDMKYVDGETIVSFRGNNHRYDLSSYDYKSGTTFDGHPPVQVTIEEEFMGGHHVSGSMTFDGEYSGVLVIILTNELQFSFDL